jgi:hypothetical protein
MQILTRGTPLEMSDGWRGVVLRDYGDAIVCYRGDFSKNDTRVFPKHRLTTTGGRHVVEWRGASADDPARLAWQWSQAERGSLH